MAVSVTMPRLGESVSEGTVTRWLKKEGEHVEADEPLLEVSTDKVDTEIPSPTAGTLQAIRVGEDETVEVGAELAVIDDGAGAARPEPEQPAAGQEQAAASIGQRPEQEPAAPPAAPEPRPEPAPQRTQAPVQPTSPPEQPDEEAPAQPAASAEQRERGTAESAAPAPHEEGVEAEEGDAHGPSYVTPLVRRLAAEHGVDLADLHGTGVGGRIRKQDVLDAARQHGDGRAAPGQPDTARTEAGQQSQTPAARRAGAPPAATAEATRPAAEAIVRGHTEKIGRLRKLIAERMVESLHVSAQLTTVVEADITRVARLRERARAEFETREGVKLSFLPFFALATCEALREHPAVNSSIDLEGGTVTYHDAVNLGIAVDTPRGLLVPVIRDASDLNLAGLARKVADLAERTRGNHITPDELAGGTFTLTNTGSRGALFDTPIINQPQVGILGTGSVVKRPVVVDDPDVGEVIAVRHVVYLALTYDHRIVDGADAARFVSSIKDRLQEGEFEAELGL